MMENSFDFLVDLKYVSKSEILFLICEYLDQYSNMRMADLLDFPDLAAINSSFTQATDPALKKRTNYSPAKLVQLSDIPIYPECIIGMNFSGNTFNQNTDDINKFEQFRGNKLVFADLNISDILNQDFKSVLANIQEVTFEDIFQIKRFGSVELKNVAKLNIKFKRLMEWVNDNNRNWSGIIPGKLQLTFSALMPTADWRSFDHVGFKRTFANLEYMELSEKSYTYFIKNIKRRRDEPDNKQIIKIFPETMPSLAITISDFRQIYYNGPQLPAGLRKLYLKLDEYVDFKFTGVKFLPDTITTLWISTSKPLNLDQQIPNCLEDLVITLKPRFLSVWEYCQNL